MRDLRLPTSLACVVTICGLATNPAAKAASITVPGASCQLSIPTTNTGVRPKATGFRNESTTTGNFVICPMAGDAGGTNYDTYSYGQIFIKSLDGIEHDVSCTAVVGDGNWTQLKYSTMTIVAPANTSQAGTVAWGSANFGQAPNQAILGSTWFTFTCNLPPQTVILSVRGY